MSLANLVLSGRQRKPICAIIYGVHGCGKSTIASESDAPIFITAEEIEEVNAAKLPKCQTWNDVVKYAEMILKETHAYKTLVIDTLDSIETLLHKKILEDDNAKDMATAHGGYGKAYLIANQMLIDFRDKYLVPIREKGMNIILLCHSTRNKIEDPITQTAYDTHELKLQKSARGVGAYTIFSEWVSMILFMNFEIFKVKGDNTDKKFMIGEGERIIHCSPRPMYDAKNRFNFPDEMPYKKGLGWKTIVALVDKFYAEVDSPETKLLTLQLNDMAGKIKDEKLKSSTLKNIESIGSDTARLEKARAFIQNVLDNQ